MRNRLLGVVLGLLIPMSCSTSASAQTNKELAAPATTTS